MDMQVINKHYTEGNYEQMHELLKLSKDHNDPTTLYNLGVAEFKRENYPQARLHWERLKAQGASANELRHNLKVVKKRLDVEYLEKDSGMNHIIHIGQSELGLTVILLFFFIASIAFYRKFLRVGLLLACLAVFLFATKFLYIDTFCYALSMQRVSVYDGPSKIFNEIHSLPPGVKVIKGKSSGRWVFINSPKEFTGWVDKDSLKEI